MLETFMVTININIKKAQCCVAIVYLGAIVVPVLSSDKYRLL